MMRRTQPGWFILSLVLGLALSTGCSDKDDDDSDHPPQLTARPVIFQAQAEGGQVLLTVDATDPDGDLETVTVDLTGIGGLASQALLDDGTQGDVAGGDGTFTYLYTLPASVTVGDKVLVVVATDSAGLTGGADLLLAVNRMCLDYPNLRLDTDTAGSAASTSPRIACTGTTVLNVYTVWEDARNTAPDIYLNRSTDGGDTWQTSDMRINTNSAGTSNSSNPEVSCTGTNVYVAWEDLRNGAGSDIYFRRSTDEGATWEASDLRVDTDTAGAFSSCNIEITSLGDNVYIVWTDNRDGYTDIYFNCSLDRGATWLVSDVRLNTDTAGAATAQAPAIVCNGNDVYVAWQDDRNGSEDIYFNYSNDRGVTWQVSDIRIDTDTGSNPSLAPRIDSTGNSVYILWEDERNGEKDVYFSVSSNGGSTWPGSDTRLDTDTAGAAGSSHARMTHSGDVVLVAWQDLRNGSEDIYFNTSTDRGSTWLAVDLRVDTDTAGAAASILPQLTCSGSNVYVAWQDGRCGSEQIFMNYSLDSGLTWGAADIRILATSPGSAQALTPTLICMGDNFYTAWSDLRNGSADIYFEHGEYIP